MEKEKKTWARPKLGKATAKNAATKDKLVRFNKGGFSNEINTGFNWNFHLR